MDKKNTILLGAAGIAGIGLAYYLLSRPTIVTPPSGGVGAGISDIRLS